MHSIVTSDHSESEWKCSEMVRSCQASREPALAAVRASTSEISARIRRSRSASVVGGGLPSAQGRSPREALRSRSVRRIPSIARLLVRFLEGVLSDDAGSPNLCGGGEVLNRCDSRGVLVMREHTGLEWSESRR